MERTISGMMGKGSVSHNKRNFTAKNVDRRRSKENVEFCHEDIKQVYHKLFDEALERYNARQKRNDRKIDDYYEKIRQGKQEKLFHEVIFQIGNKDDTNARDVMGQIAKVILMQFMEDFQSRNPYLYVFSAHLHMDEETPHLHIDFVPFIRGSQRGLDMRVSLKGALGEQGFKGGTRGETEWNQWINSEKEELAAVMERHGIRWWQKGTHKKHLSVLNFEKQERAKEFAELSEKRDVKLAELLRLEDMEQRYLEDVDKLDQKQADLEYSNRQLEQEQDHLRQENTRLLQEQEGLEEDNRSLENEQKKMQDNIEQIIQSEQFIQRDVRKYDEDPQWQLPEPGAFMSAKTYRDKVALSLVDKLKEWIKNLTIQCVWLKEEVIQLREKVQQLVRDVEFYKGKVREVNTQMLNLQERANELECVRNYIGNEQIDRIISMGKRQEVIEKCNRGRE